MATGNRNEQAGTNASITTNGAGNGQIAVGATVIQIGTVNGGQIHLQPAAPPAGNQPVDGNRAGSDRVAKDATLSPPAADQEELVMLRQALSSLFDQGELRDLAFDLAVDYDDLPGAAKKDKARELVAFCRRRGRLAELKLAIEERRPGAL